MRTGNDNVRFSRAFTLVELILVMGILATLLALAAPSLSRSFGQHDLDQEATRLLALTEYGRDEAVSQGIPMVVWIDPRSGSFGVEAKSGFDGDESRKKGYSLGRNSHFEVDSATVGPDGQVEVAEFAPDGTLDASSLDSVSIVSRSDAVVSVSQTDDGAAYEIVKEGR